jgi:hypothetical protein
LASKYKGKEIPAVKITANRVLINVTKEAEEEYEERTEINKVLQSCRAAVRLKSVKVASRLVTEEFDFEVVSTSLAH